MKLETTHKKFIEELRSEGKSGATVIAYNKDIEQLLSYLAEKNIVETEDLDIENISDFMKSLEELNYTPKSISRKTNATRTFIKYLAKNDYIEEDISTQLKHPKFESGKPRILSKMEYRALRDSAKDDVRSYAMIEILLQTGITISELAGIELSDITIKNGTGTLVIPRRNNRVERTIPLNKAAIEALNRYLEFGRPKETKEPSNNLFITKTGKPLLIRNIRSTIDRFFRIAGVEKAKVNDLRHTFVAFHLENGVNISYLAKVAGHKRESTTEKYLEYINKPEKMDKTELGIL
jgi:site-specific recombinase XerD